MSIALSVLLFQTTRAKVRMPRTRLALAFEGAAAPFLSVVVRMNPLRVERLP